MKDRLESALPFILFSVWFAVEMLWAVRWTRVSYALHFGEAHDLLDSGLLDFLL